MLAFYSLITPSWVSAQYPENWYEQRSVFETLSADPTYNDPVIDNLVGNVRASLETANGFPANFLRVEVMACPEPHAVVYTGGYLEICLSLLLQLETEDEIAFLIAHEMSHVANAQIAQNPADFVPHSLTDEIAADRFAIPMVVKAGYSPDGALTFLEKNLEFAGVKDRFEIVLASIEERYLTESEERSFKIFNQEAVQSMEKAGAYIATIDLVYRDIFALIRNRSSWPRDGIAPESDCRSIFDRLVSLKDSQGFDEPLLHASVIAFYWCGKRTSSSEAFKTLLRETDPLADLSYSSLGLISAIPRIDRDYAFANLVFNEYERRMFQYPQAYPTLRGMEKAKAHALTFSSRYHAACDAAGTLNEKSFIQRFASPDRHFQQRMLRILKLPKFVSNAINECGNRILFSQKRTLATYRRFLAPRLKSGMPKHIAEQEARIMAVSSEGLNSTRAAWAINKAFAVPED